MVLVIYKIPPPPSPYLQNIHEIGNFGAFKAVAIGAGAARLSSELASAYQEAARAASGHADPVDPDATGMSSMGLEDAVRLAARVLHKERVRERESLEKVNSVVSGDDDGGGGSARGDGGARGQFFISLLIRGVVCPIDGGYVTYSIFAWRWRELYLVGRSMEMCQFLCLFFISFLPRSYFLFDWCFFLLLFLLNKAVSLFLISILFAF